RTKTGGSDSCSSTRFTFISAALAPTTITPPSLHDALPIFSGTNRLTAQDVYSNTVTGFDASANNVTLTANSPLTGTVSGLHGANDRKHTRVISSHDANSYTVCLTYTSNATASTFTATSANG